MFLVVGLGNPGPKYRATRHNVGFEAVDLLADRHRLGDFKSWKSAEVCRGTIAGEDVLLVKPQTFMNLSGEAVQAAMTFYKVLPQQVIVIHDELDFEPGVLRVKEGGGHGGHNGLRSIAAHVGREFVRIRLGIGKAPPHIDGADWVLSRFDSTSRQAVNEALIVAADAVEVALKEGVAVAMNRFNRREREPGNESDELAGARGPGRGE